MGRTLDAVDGLERADGGIDEPGLPPQPIAIERRPFPSEVQGIVLQRRLLRLGVREQRPRLPGAAAGPWGMEESFL